MLYAFRTPQAILIGSLLCLAATAAAAERAKPDLARDLQRLALAEQTWARALETGDVRLLESFVDEDTCTFIGPDGQLEDRTAYLEGYRQLDKLGVKVDKITMDQVEMRVLGDTAIVTGHVVARVLVQGNAIVEDVRFTRVYARRGAAWRMVAGQGTRITPPPSPANP